MHDTSLQLELLDINQAVRTMLEAMATGVWPLEARIHGHLAHMLHRCDLKLRAASFCERAA